ncbi:MAG: hypothetical protein ACR2PY_06365 [Salinispira sp.]
MSPRQRRQSSPRQRRGRRRSRNTLDILSRSSEKQNRHIAQRDRQPAYVYLPPPVPEKEYDPCPISGEVIDNIYIAISDPDSGRPARFDKVLEHIGQQEALSSEQRLAYIGAGNFGILENKTENGRLQIQLMKKIPYEDPYDRKKWRKELSPGISRDYVPNPQPLDDLYTREEIRAFPSFEFTRL